MWDFNLFLKKWNTWPAKSLQILRPHQNETHYQPETVCQKIFLCTNLKHQCFAGLIINNFLFLNTVSITASLQNCKDLMDKKRTEFFTDHWVCYQVEIILQIPYLSPSTAERATEITQLPLQRKLIWRTNELGRTRRRKTGEYMTYFSFFCEFKEHVFTH